MGVLTLADEAGAPGTPADGASLYSISGALRYKTDGGTVHVILTDQASGVITNTMMATDAKIGSLAALTTTDKDSVTDAIIEVDANADAANAENVLSRGGMASNVVWDPYNEHVEDKGLFDGKSWWQDSTTLSIVVDSSHPYGGKTLRTTGSGYGKGVYLSDVGLAPGDVVSAGLMCKAASGTYACRLIFRTTGPGASAVSTLTGSTHTFSGDTYALTIANITIPATANWVSIVPYSASPTSIDIYGTWMHRGIVAATVPSPSPFTASYLRLKEWETNHQRLMVRNVDTDNFYVFQPQPDDQSYMRWDFTKLATGNWTYYGAYACADNAGTGAYAAMTFDIGYAINYTPSGQTAETCGNHHLYDDFTVINFYDEAGTVVDPTASGAAFLVRKLRIEQKGTLRHPDTAATDHATISRFIDITTEHVYEHMRLSWLTSNNLVSYWNTGQILAGSATKAWVQNSNDAAFVVGDSTLTVTGKTKAYSWYATRKFVFEVECPTAEAVQLRETTLKVYPRTIEADVTRDAGDVDHAEWYWRVVWDKQFEKRI